MILFKLVFWEYLSTNIELYCGYRQYIDSLVCLITRSRLLIGVPPWGEASLLVEHPIFMS